MSCQMYGFEARHRRYFEVDSCSRRLTDKPTRSQKLRSVVKLKLPSQGTNRSSMLKGAMSPLRGTCSDFLEQTSESKRSSHKREVNQAKRASREYISRARRCGHMRDFISRASDIPISNKLERRSASRECEGYSSRPSANQ